MSQNIDLQCHTTASDGKLTPTELVNLAIGKRLAAIAITDHDSVGGIDEALKAAKGKNIEIIVGVEISCDDPGFVDTHILGLFIDHKSSLLNNLLKRAKESRTRQKKGMIMELKKLGFSISYNEVNSIAKGEIGRPHIAQVLLEKNPGEFSSTDEIFDTLIGVGKKAFVERKNKINAKEAVQAIHSAKGLAFVAHPGVYRNFDVNKFIRYFVKNGGDGIETYYQYKSSRHKVTKETSESLNKKFQLTAKKLNLLQTGGSDFHGKEQQKLGELKVPYKVLEELKKHLKK